MHKARNLTVLCSAATPQAKDRAEIYALDILKAQLPQQNIQSSLPRGATSARNTLVVVGGFASLVTGVCVLTGEVDAPALFDAVQAGNFWQWVVRPGGD